MTMKPKAQSHVVFLSTQVTAGTHDPGQTKDKLCAWLLQCNNWPDCVKIEFAEQDHVQIEHYNE